MKNLNLFFWGVTLLLVLLFGNAFAQVDIKKCKKFDIENFAKEGATLRDALKKYNNDTLGFISCLKLSIHDSLKYETVSPVINAVQAMAIKSGNNSVKKNSLKFILQNLNNKNNNVAILAIKNLWNYPKNLFDSSDINIIEQNINEKSKVYKDLVLLAGYIGNPKLKAKINSIFPNSRNYTKPEKWSTYIALARLGDESSINYCISRVSSLPLNDNVIDILYPDLVYTHQKQAYDIMVESLFSDDKLCSSANPNSDTKIICGYRILELLAPRIENFPIEVLPSGDLKTDSYPNALEIARNWFNDNKKSYRILDNKY